MADSLFDGLDLGSDLQTFQKNVSSSMNDVKSAILTPISATMTKVNEGVALIKATDSKLQSVVSEYKSVAVSQLDGIIGALSGGMLNTSDLTKMVRVGPDGVTFNTDDLVRSVGDQIGLDISGGQGGFMQQFANGINSQFNSITGSYFGNLVDTDGNTFRISKNWRGQAGSSLLNMLNRYGGFDEFIDTSVTNSFYNTLLFNSAQYGMADSYESILKNYTFAKDGQSALLDAVQYMLANGDVNSLEAVIKIMEKDGIMSVNAKYPLFVETLLSKFSFSVDTTQDQHPAIRASLLNVLNTFAGPNWHLTATQFGTAYNLMLTSSISADVVTLLMEDEKYSPLLYASGMYQDNSAVDTFKNDFAGVPILTDGI